MDISINLKYKNIEKGTFLVRPNRFIADVQINGEICRVHVKNTGRCRELLLPGAEVYLEKAENPDRKTGYDLVAVRKGNRIVNIDYDNENLKGFLAEYENSISMPKMLGTGNFWVQLEICFSKIWGGADIEEELSLLAEKIQKQLV